MCMIVYLDVCGVGGGGVIVYIAVWIMSASDASEMLKLCPGLK